MNHSYRLTLFITTAILVWSSQRVVGQSPSAPADSVRGWVGQRILMLKGFGEVHHAAEGSPVRSSVGINLVMGVARVEGSRLWVRSTSGNDSGWVDSTIAIRLSEAIPYLSAMIARDSANWDLYLRRAEAEHALNQREAATVDYTTAIRLHPTEAFLYLRRGRHYNTVHECDKELADFEQAIASAPTSAPQGYDLIAELYSLESVVYSGCPDSTRRDPHRALVTIQRAIARDSTRGTFFVVLASAYARTGDLRAAVEAQKHALRMSSSAPSYREDWERQLRELERALATSNRNGP
jgi:tetratricopeptide (TPR) repeat protein